MFKSKAIKVVDLKDISISDELLEIEVGEKDIADLLLNTARKYTEFVEIGDVVKPGALVSVDMESKVEKFNKKDEIMAVGIGLFNKDFEKQILGMKKNEIKLINIDGNCIVTKIKNIKQKIVPEITDKIVAAQQIKDVNTVSEYKQYLYKQRVLKIQDEKLNTIFLKILDEIENKSEFLLEDEDINIFCQEELARCRAIGESLGKAFDEMTEKEMLGAVGKKNVREFEEFLRKESYPKRLKQVLAAMEICKTKNITINQETYEKYLSEHICNEKVKKEKAEILYPYYSYIAGSYINSMRETIYEYFKSKFIVKIVQ